mmetsp:Transcript_8958/g.28283  ORF Transcript_8958/g.28283 Transcript_8958/m.28283 type:complete len:290 (+) Transcript_8958:1991-2860(+)
MVGRPRDLENVMRLHRSVLREPRQLLRASDGADGHLRGCDHGPRVGPANGANVGQREGGPAQLLLRQLVLLPERLQPGQLVCDLGHRAVLHVVHHGHQQPARRVHGHAQVVARVQRHLRQLVVHAGVQRWVLQQRERGGLEEERHHGDLDALALSQSLELPSQLQQRVHPHLVVVAKVRDAEARAHGLRHDAADAADGLLDVLPLPHQHRQRVGDRRGSRGRRRSRRSRHRRLWRRCLRGAGLEEGQQVVLHDATALARARHAAQVDAALARHVPHRGGCEGLAGGRSG